MKFSSLALVYSLILPTLYAQHPTEVADPWPYDAARYYDLNHDTKDSVLTKTVTFRVDNEGKLLQKTWVKGPAFGGGSIEVEYFEYSATGIQDRYQRYRFLSQSRTLEYEWEKMFDNSGNLLQKTSYYLYGSAFGNATRELALYEGGQIREFGFVENDNGSWDTASKVLSTVSEGNIVQVERFRYDMVNQQFLPTMREMFEYDDDGRTRSTSSMKPVSQSPSPEWIPDDSTWRAYDELGRLVYFKRFDWQETTEGFSPTQSTVTAFGPSPIVQELVYYRHSQNDSTPLHRQLERDSAGIRIIELQSWSGDCGCWQILNGYKSLIRLDGLGRESQVETFYFTGGDIHEQTQQLSLYHSTQGEVYRYSRQTTPVSWWSDSAVGSSIVFEVNEFAGQSFETGESIPFTVFPNPGESRITIGMDEPAAATLQILDLAGRLIYQQEINGQFPVVGLPPMTGGVYLIRLIRAGKVHTQKFAHR